VPQGSVLGPSLLLFYINDISVGTNSTIRLFADDTIAYLTTVSSPLDCSHLQKDLDRLVLWEEKWKMAFHPDKCSVLRITRKQQPLIHDYTLYGQILKSVTSVKYLGFTVNNRLDWGEHTSNICSKANQTLVFLRSNLHIGSTKIKEQAYKSLVRPLCEYACPVWDPYEKTDINAVEMIQRRAARYVRNNYRNRSSVGAMLLDLGWQSLEERRYEARLYLLYKIYHGMVAVDGEKYLIPPRRFSRNMHRNSFQLPSTTSLYRKESFFPRTIRDWNNLPSDVASAPTLESFKAQVAYLPH